MNIHPNLRTRLVEITTKALAKMTVNHGMFLQTHDVDLLADGDTALDNQQTNLLRLTVSDHPFSGFVTGFLYDQVREAFKYDSAANAVPLIGLPGFEDGPAVATRVVDAFGSLPWSYAFIYPLPLKATFAAGAPHGDEEYAFTPQLSLVRPGPTFEAAFPVMAGGSTLAEIMAARFGSADRPSQWNPDSLYLVHKANGFLTELFYTQLAKDERLLIRMFGGLMEASGLARYHYSAPVASLYEDTANRTWIYSYIERDGSFANAPSVSLDAEHNERLRSLRWLDVPEIQETHFGAWVGWVAGHLNAAFANTEAAALLRRSCQWHFDSLCGTNHLLQFVQATVAVEILLGDKASSDVIGLGELLANRCAYSLASTVVERQTLLKSFREIYDTRSQIVHRGKAALSDEETKRLYELMYLGRRLIQKELDLMRAKNS